VGLHLRFFNCPYSEPPEGLTKHPERVKLEPNTESSTKKEKAMKESVNQAICDFYNSVWNYMKAEYKPKWARLYNAQGSLDEMIQLTGQYYLGGNNVVDTAGDIVKLLKKKHQ